MANLLTFLEEISPLLPERIRHAFTAIVRQHLKQAFETCKSAKRLTLEKDTRYQDEEGLYKQWVKDICSLKISLYNTLMDNLITLMEMPSVDFLSELARLDEIPIDQQKAFLQAVGASMGISQPEMLQNLMRHLPGQLAVKIINEAQKHEDLAKYLLFLAMLTAQDGLDPNLPQTLMNMALQAAQRDNDSRWMNDLDHAIRQWLEKARANNKAKNKPRAEEISKVESSLDGYIFQIFFIPRGGMGENPDWERKEPQLEEFIEQYPLNGSGYFYHMAACHQIAMQKTKAGDTRAAQVFFDKATVSAKKVLKYAQSKQQREQADELLGNTGTFKQNLGMAAANKGDYDAARDQLLGTLKTDVDTPELVRQVMHIFLNEARVKKDSARHSEMNRAVMDWLDRARKPGSAVEQKEIGGIEIQLDDYLTLMFLAPLGQLDKHTDWSEVHTAMLLELTSYPENVSARYYNMMSLYQLANQKADVGNRTQARQLLTQSAREAMAVIEYSKNEAHRKQAQKIQDQIQDVLGVIN